MAVVAKMRCDEVMARGGGTLLPLCSAKEIMESWPPDPEQIEKIGIYNHGPEYCERCAQAAEGLPEGSESVGFDGKASEEVKLMAVSSGGGANDPNAKWAAATPAGELTMTINNPGAWGFFDPGAEYTVEIRKHVPSRGKRGSTE